MISVFTPSHNPTYLDDCYESLIAQTYQEWEWVVVLNDNAPEWVPPADKRVRLFRVNQISGVGAAKSYACEQASGEILVEFDHDDYLLPSALAEISLAIQKNPEASMVYSHFAETNDILSWSGQPFDSAHGWTYEEIVAVVYNEERKFLQINAMDASYPHNAHLIWYAPNHVRAFPRWAYDRAGGYDHHLTVLDDQDIMARLFRFGDFVLIPKCLYLQRMGSHNTQRHVELNARIQTETLERYEKTINDGVLAWCDRRGLKALDLGGAHNPAPGYAAVDQMDAPWVEYVGDVIDVLRQLGDDTVGAIRAVDFLEHIPDRVQLFNEMYRVLAHGGMLLSLTPSTDGRGAWQDPTHISYYNENAFWYFTDRETAKYVPSIASRWQVSRLATYYPTPWHAANNIYYVNANLVALKSGPRMGGLCSWQ